MIRKPWIAGLALLWTAPCGAGELRIPVVAAPPVAPVGLEGQIASDSLDLTHTGAFWSFKFKADGAPFARAAVFLVNSTGLAATSYTIAVPYYWDVAGSVSLATPAVKPQSTDQATNDFVTRATANQSASSLILFNAQARMLWQARAARFASVAPESVDARLAYWLIQSSGALTRKFFVEVDPVTESAIQWLEPMISTTRPTAFFTRSGVSVADAQTAIQIIRDRDRTLYSAILNKVSAEIGSFGKSTRACKVAASLDRMYDDLEGNVGDAYSGWQTHQLIAATDQAYCLATEVNMLTRQGQLLASDKVQEARDLLSKIDRLASSTALPDNIRSAARARAAELAAKLPVDS